MIVITHPFINLIPDGTDTTVQRPSDWNAQHTIVWQSSTVAGLPSVTPAGKRWFVTDSNATLAAGLGNIVATGGVNKVPVYSDGINWRIG